ncbi:MAG: hypothetical protein JW746_05950 [Candidatus Krumholzibacteriota bacterium]|nr:hypothetical protein [Candidatus Krumholzibacteriota bacterium]
MFARTFQLLALLFLVVAMVGCEGAEGPAGAVGPEGPPGPSVVLCMGEINCESTPTVVSSWPSDVTIAISGSGIYDITLTGTFPETEGILLTSNVDSNAARSIASYITSWSTTTIVFRIGIWNILSDVFVDGEFSFIILGEPL